MVSESVQAFIIHKQQVGETSLLVQFFSRELGMFRSRLKGGRSAKKQASIQAFNPVWLSIQRKALQVYCNSLEPCGPGIQLEGSQLLSGLYINELLHHMMPYSEAHPELFDSYQFCLQSLSQSSSQSQIEQSLRRFEWSLLCNFGLQMSLTEDIEGFAIETNQCYCLKTGEGFLRSDTGILGAHILAFSENTLDDLEVLRSIKRIMRKAIDHALDGKPLKTRSLYA